MNATISLSARDAHLLVNRMTVLVERIKTEAASIKHSEKTVELIHKAIEHYNTRLFRMFKADPEKYTTENVNKHQFFIPVKVRNSGPSYASTTVLLYQWFEPDSLTTHRLVELSRVYSMLKYRFDVFKYAKHLKYERSNVTLGIWDYCAIIYALESNLYGENDEKEKS